MGNDEESIIKTDMHHNLYDKITVKDFRETFYGLYHPYTKNMW